MTARDRNLKNGRLIIQAPKARKWKCTPFVLEVRDHKRQNLEADFAPFMPYVTNFSYYLQSKRRS